ncbi:tyrosine-protein phosphatase [Pragia fontium]|uniref:tyrosine-protein phosphatase n=1 Tax=Pragia fontium TaxID=82985 RepID=UPI000F71B340|nr:tyrosine-protein phosphatase [Pragia fontium]VEJ52897.1 Protein tyrosine/serine phosphatase [Pragia fontium]
MTTINLLHSSLLPLQGGINFRDQGGNLAQDGRKVKPGLLLRAGALDRLTVDDCHYLSQIPLTNIIDYRDADEVKAKPDVVWQGVQYDNIPANPLTDEVNANFAKLTDEALASFNAVDFMSRLYNQLPFNNQAYRHLTQVMQQPGEGALVQHCAVGKDRTGIGSAIALLALGASRDTVIEDYMLTETTLAPYRTEILNHMSAQLSEQHGIDSLSYVMSAKETFIGTALKAIEQRYGNTDNWLEQEFGLTPVIRQQMQNKYLEG